MAQIEGVNLPLKKRVEYGLTYIKGIGLKTSRDILGKLDINLDTRIKDLTDQQIAAIAKEASSNYEIEGNLQKRDYLNVQRLKEIGCYRGTRHKVKLPVRGQRTKTNARTRKGPKGRAVSGKRKLTKK